MHLFEPRSYKFDYKVIVTNKKSSANKLRFFHNGRGAQEKIFAEAKSDAQLETRFADCTDIRSPSKRTDQVFATRSL